MVFEAIAVEFLNKFLKQYVENLDTSQLKIGIWGGDVVLHDLKIKSTLFDGLNLPLRVKWGKLGKFSMKIPWKNLYSSQVTIDIEGLLLVTIPNIEYKYDPVKEENWAQDRKLAKIRAVEEAKKRDQETETIKQNDSFTEKLLTQITKNLQIIIRNIHIRYEDKSTVPDHPFSSGITLSNLSAQTTTTDYAQMFPMLSQEVENLIYKVVHLSGLSIYWNSCSDLVSDLPEDRLANFLLKSIPTASHKPKDFMYMFGPLTASAFLRLNPKPEIDGSNFTIPKIFVNVHLKEIDLAVTHNQFCDIMAFLQDYQRLSVAAKYKKYRPVGTPVIGHAKLWWHFAYNAVMEDIIRRRNEWSWKNIKEHREMCRKYFELFKMKLHSRKMPPKEANELNFLERKLNVFNLILIREQVYVEVERSKSIIKESTSKSWFSGWFGSWGEQKDELKDEELVKRIESVMTTQEKQKLYRAIGYEESAPPTNYPTDFVEVQFWFDLDEMKMIVHDDPRTDSLPVMVLVVKSVRVEFEQRPSAFAMKFVVIIGNFQVTGKHEKNKPNPELVTSNCKESESLIEVIYETKPLNTSCDQRIIVNAQPLSIIFHAKTINLVRNIFTYESSEETEKIVAATSATLPTFRKITSMGLQYAIEKRTVLEVKVNIKSSYLIIPYGGVYDPEKDMLVLMLGSLSIESEETPFKEIRSLFLEGVTDEEIFSTVLSASYTRFKCLLTGVQVLFQLSGEDWVEASKLPKSSMQFLEPINLEVTIKKALVVDDARIPKMIVECKLPSVTFNFSEQRFVSFIALACSIPTQPVKTSSGVKKTLSISAWSVQSLGSQLESTFKRESNSAQKPREYMQGIGLVGNFEMNELKVNVSKTRVSSDSTAKLKASDLEEQFLSLSLVKLEIEFTSKTFETIHLLKLGRIEFKQHLKRTWLPIVSTKRKDQDHYLFLVEFINLDTKIPDFYTTKGGIVNRLTLNITPLNVLLEKEALLAQIAFVTKVQRRVDQVREASYARLGSDFTRMRDGILEEATELTLSSNDKKVITKGRRFRRKSSQQEVIDFFLQASIDEICVRVEFKAEGLTEFNLKGGRIDISNRKAYATLDVNIQEVCVLDLDRLTKYTKILWPLEDQTLSSRVTIYNKEYFGSENTMDLSIDAEIGGIQIVCLSLYFSRVIKFLGAFQSQVESLKEGASIAAQKAKQNMVKAFHNAAQICLNVRMTAPILKIPKTSFSPDTLTLDLGVLTIKNSIAELDYSPDGETKSRPLIDTVKFHLQNLKVTRCPDYSEINERTFLVPVTFDLMVKRNLSAAWFRVIPELEVLARLASVRVNVTHEDLWAIMNIVQENLQEGGKLGKGDKNLPHKKLENKLQSKPRGRNSSRDSMVPDEEKKDHSPFYSVAKFEFFMDSFVFDALVEKKDSRWENTGLARFILEAMSLKGRIFSDGAINTSVTLQSCLLDDTRPGKEGRLTRLLERTVDSNPETSHVNSMIEIIYRKKEYDNFVDVRVYRFTLALSMDFLQKLRVFFTLKDYKSEEADGTTEYSKNIKEKEEKRAFTFGSDQNPAEISQTFTLNLKLEKPDIIFVENMDSINTDALIFHTEMVMKYRLAGKKQVISGTLRDLELYSCCFNPEKRHRTLNQVVKPFSISVAGSTPEGAGLHVDVCLTDIVISISPATVDLITKCYEALLKDASISRHDSEEKIYSDLWDVKPLIEDDFQFFKAEVGEDALKYSKTSSSVSSFWEPDEICLLAIPSITLYVEGLSSIHGHPVILLEMGFQMRCQDWSRKMVVTSSLTAEMRYYNKTYSAWEPLLEPVEKYVDQNKPSHSPWELFCTISFDEEGELEGLFPPKVQIILHCEDTLNLTFTKTCVEVLKNALDTYTTAVTKHVVKKIVDPPPYVVKNETGLEADLLLEKSELRVYKSLNENYNTVRLNTNSEVELRDADISSEMRQVTKADIRLSVKFPTIGENVIELPVGVSCKRYFPLTGGEAGCEVWGLVCQVLIVEQMATVTFLSQLQIKNYFNEPINVHSLSEKGTVAEFIGTVEGNSSFNVPIPVCHKANKKLFFSARGYSLCTEPFPWQTLQKELEMSLLLQCLSKIPENYDPFFIQAVGETEQVYYANTKRKTLASMVYKIHLQPTVKIFNSLPVALEVYCQGRARETTLQPGNQTQITNAEPGTSTLTLRISDYLEKEWSCKEALLENPGEFLIWKFVSYNGLTAETLNLGVHRTYSRKTAVYSVYSPYFMLNKTGHLLSYKFEQIPTVFYHPGNLNSPLMFSPTSKNFYGKKEASLQVEQSLWSDKFPVDVAGSGGTVECKEADSDFSYKISVNITLTYNGLTKMVVFTPFYVLVNSVNFSIECQEMLAPGDSWLEIPPQSYLPFWPISREKGNTIRIRPKGSEATTPAFSFYNTDDCLLRLSHECGGIFVNVRASQSGTCITFSSYEPGQAPALILNSSYQVIKLYEEGTDFQVTLKPFEQVMHAWVSPTGSRKIIAMTEKEEKENISLNQDSFGVVATCGREVVHYASFLHGSQRVLIFSEDNSLVQSLSTMKLPISGMEIICRIQGIGISLVNNINRVEIMYIELLSSDVTWQCKKHGKNRFKPMRTDEVVHIETAYQSYKERRDSPTKMESIINVEDKFTINFETMEMIKPTPKELKRTFEPGFWLGYRELVDQKMLHVKINKLQVDSQLQECVFPVVLAMLPPPRSVTSKGPKPFLELSVIRVEDQKGIVQYKYFKTLIQEFHVKLDMAFIQQVYMFLAAEEISDEEHKIYFKKDLAFAEKPLMEHFEVFSLNEQKSFFDLLHFPPLKIHFSFSLAGKLEGNDRLPPSFSVLLQSLGVTLTDVNDVVFRLSYLERKNVFLTKKELRNEVVSHYMGQIVRQAYVLLLGLDVIGNPYGLIVGIGEGVEAFFYEPFQGMIQGPSEFGKGMAIGCKTLFGHTVGSAAGTLGKLTETLGKGLAVLSLDKEYQMQRMVEHNRHENIQASMARGGKGLVMGVVEGVAGVVQKPLQGAKDEGVGGFFKGMGKGLMGLVTRPVTGVVDLASTSFNAVKRATVLSSANRRLRQPRFFRDDQLVEPYNSREAEGNAIFLGINKRKYSYTDKYEHHLFLREKEVIVLTNKRMILAEHNELFGTWQEHMAITWRSMPSAPYCHGKGVALTIPDKSSSRKKKDRADVKVLLIEEELVKEAFCKKMAELYHMEKQEEESITPR